MLKFAILVIALISQINTIASVMMTDMPWRFRTPLTPPFSTSCSAA